MSFLASLVAPESRASIEGPLPITSATVVEWLDGPASSTGVRVSPEGALRLAAAFACVRVIAEDVAKLPLHLMEQLQPRGKRMATAHPLYAKLHRVPNPHMTSMQMRETMQGHLLTRGNAYASIERDDFRGDIVGLWPLRPDRMSPPVLAGDGRLLYTYTLPNGEPRALTQDDVLHVRGLSTDGIMGYAPITMHRETLGWAIATRDYGARFFGNGSRPGGVLQAKTKLSKEAADRLRVSWNEAHKGLENSHRVAVLEEGVEWKQVGIAPEDAQFLEAMTFQVQDVCRIFRVPPHKVAELSRATFDNIEEMNITYVAETLQSWLERWEQQMNKDLLREPEQASFFFKHNMDALLRGKMLDRYQAYQVGILAGILNPNEARDKEDMNPFEGGDTHIQPLNYGPWGAEPAQPEPQQSWQKVRLLSKTADGGYSLVEREERDSDG